VFWGTRWFFSANTGRFWEPTSGLEPLTCSLRVSLSPHLTPRKYAILQVILWHSCPCHYAEYRPVSSLLLPLLLPRPFPKLAGVPAIGPHVMRTCPSTTKYFSPSSALDCPLAPYCHCCWRGQPNVLLTCKCDSDRRGSKFGITPPPVFRVGKPKKKSRIQGDVEYKRCTQAKLHEPCTALRTCRVLPHRVCGRKICELEYERRGRLRSLG
jgi:hypothetical protein